MANINREIADIFREIIRILEIQGQKQSTSFKINAYRKAIRVLDALEEDIESIYEREDLEGITKLGIGEKNAKKIEQYIKRRTIKEYEDLQEESAIQQVITHFFESKGVSLQELKNNAKKRKIVYSRYTKPAKQLLELTGSLEKAKNAITTVAKWANTRKLDYAIETVFKKWLELDRLQPKEKVKKPFYNGQPMVWSEMKKKWFVISKHGEWLEFADKKSAITWIIEE